MPLLEVRDLQAAYGRVTALWDVSFEVAEGQVVALLGSNGSGKTTTLRTISGLLPALSGSVGFDGRDITRARSDQIVELGAYSPRAKARRADSLQRVLELFPRLRERRNQAAGTLSGGERQMCALARGLMGLPRLIMLDEPSLGLAPRLVSEMFDTLRVLRDQGLTVLLVEQNVHQALELADTAYVLETGRLVLSGPSQQLLANPLVRSAYLGVGAR